jgi:DNA polymerase elongation subunit (family B)
MTDEVIKKINEKRAELDAIYTKYHNWEQGTKIMINSFYGGLANPYMYFFDPALAECITKQGKNAILYAERNINDYFLNHWYEDKKTHEKMGITVTKPVKKQVTVYIDTDSVYSQLDEIISTTDWGMGNETNWMISVKYTDGKTMARTFCGKKTKEYIIDYFDLENSNVESYSINPIKGEPKDFALLLDEVFLADYFKQIFEAYAKNINADNYLNFELETYSDAGIWLSKKKYMQNIRWTDSMPRHDILDNFSKIKSKGVELIQASSPTFARKKLSYLVKWIFEKDNFNLKEFVAELKKIKKELELTNIDDICWNKKATGYMKWVIDDTKELVMKKGTPITTKGIAYYNYLLEHNKQYKKKYSRLTEGNKCKYYYCKGQTSEMFAYDPGNHPIEFAPPVDTETMFAKTILNPINRVVKALGYDEIPNDLVILSKSALF